MENNTHNSNIPAGRVIDLKKINNLDTSENILSDRADDNFIAPKSTCKKYRFDFLKHFKHLEKKEEFIENEIFKEFLDEADEESKRNVLLSFVDFISRVLKLWWLPIFIIRFIWILFWRIGKLVFFTNTKTSLSNNKLHNLKSNNHEAQSLEAAAKTGSVKIFWQSLWSIPREIKNFLIGHTTEDYLYQRILIEELSKKKFNPFRQVLNFVFLSFFLILPFWFLNYYDVINLGDLQGKVLGASERAIGNLKSAQAAVTGMNLKDASEDFGAAKESFAEANDKLSAINGILFELGKVIPNDKIKLAAESREILSAGTYASSMGNNLTLAVSSLFTQDDKTVSEKLSNFIKFEEFAYEDAQKLNIEVDKINIDVLPVEYKEQFTSLKQKGSDLELILSKNIELLKKLNIFLGSETNKRYLLAFQDNAEMRATGGFIGSYALVDFKQGKITSVEAPQGGSYDTKGGMDRFIAPPEPLSLINKRWFFWDSNWWPDWKKSAEKLSWFYSKSGGPTTDGVIAFTPTVLERILEIIGPIDMSDTNGLTMTSENLWSNLRTVIEKEKADDSKVPYELAENKPKKIIGDLTKKLSEEMPKRIDREKFVKILSSLQANLNDKQILLYFKNDELQSEAESRNWAGRIKDTNKDYLSVIYTNIAGGKSDRKMVENIAHNATVQDDGSIIDTLTITRTNTGSTTDVLLGERNVEWLRIYVPEGSELVDASGFLAPDSIYFNKADDSWEKDVDVDAEEGANAKIDTNHLNTKIYTDSGKTVFANWSMVDAGQTSVITISYRLPFKLEKKAVAVEKKQGLEMYIDNFAKIDQTDQLVYSLLVQKQAGSVNVKIDSSLSLPSNYLIVWKYPNNLNTNANFWRQSMPLDSDKYWAVIINKSLN